MDVSKEASMDTARSHSDNAFVIQHFCSLKEELQKLNLQIQS